MSIQGRGSPCQYSLNILLKNVSKYLLSFESFLPGDELVKLSALKLSSLLESFEALLMVVWLSSPIIIGAKNSPSLPGNVKSPLPGLS